MEISANRMEKETTSNAPMPIKVWDKELLTPQGIKAKLDRHVIGQGRAKIQVAIAVYYQSLAFELAKRDHSTKIHPPAPIMLVGPTGNGKTMIISTACRFLDLPFIHVDTSNMVSEGIVGLSLSVLAKAILTAARDDTKRARHAVVFFDEFDKVLGTQYGESVIAQILRFLEGTEIRIHSTRNDYEIFFPSTLHSGEMLVFLGGAFQELLDAKTVPPAGFISTDERPTPSLTVEDLSNSGLRKELLGRINAIVNLTSLNEEEMVRVLTESESSPLAEIQRLVEIHGDSVQVDDAAIRRMAQLACRSGFGARALKSILLRVFSPILYISPSSEQQSFHVDEALVESLAGR